MILNERDNSLKMGGDRSVSRQSNMELLRIVAMSMVLLSHFLWFGITEKSIPDKIFYFFVPIVACGVNLFFMISGWFKIQCSFRSIVKLVVTIFLFVLVNHLLVIPFVSIDVFDKFYRHILFPISYSPYWFIKVYLFLIITAPLINAGLDSMATAVLRKFMILFILFNVYSCALGGNICNENGFSYMQGCLMYCLGYYLKRDYMLFLPVSKNMSIILFTLIILVCGLGSAFLKFLGIFTTYNSIALIAASVALFIAFTKIRLQSKLVNTLAAASLGCYLLQDGYFGWQFMYNWMHEVFLSSDTLVSKFAIYTAVFFGTWIVSLVVSPIVKYIAIRVTLVLDQIVPERIINVANINVSGQKTV